MNVLPGGRRVTTADAYLRLDATPRNLTVRPDSHVDRIVFDGTRAVGVRLADGTVVEAGRVALCAGVYELAQRGPVRDGNARPDVLAERPGG